MDWSADGWRSAFRVELRVEAIGFASRGWPVVPGTFPANSQWIGHGGALSEGPVPIHGDWQQRLDASPDEVASWWSGNQPYSLLVATGTAIGAIEVDARLGRAAASMFRCLGFPVPIVSTPDGRWYFMTRVGEQLCAELAESKRARLHSVGSWVPMPPSAFPQGWVHWRVKPAVCSWVLPTLDFVQDALCGALHQTEDVATLAAAGSR